MDDRSFNKSSIYSHRRTPPSPSTSSRYSTAPPPVSSHLADRPPPTSTAASATPPPAGTYPLGYPTVTVMAPIGYYQPHFYAASAAQPNRYFGSLEPPSRVLPLWNLYSVPGPQSPRPTSVIRHTGTNALPSIIQRAPKIPSPPRPPPEEDGAVSRKRRRKSTRRFPLPDASLPESPALPNPSTSHAVYAKFNRERRKTYIGEMESYRSRMRKVVAESRVTLNGIEAEKGMLSAEIDRLGQELTKNERLMSVLKSLSR